MEANLVITLAKTTAFEKLYIELGDKVGEKNLYIVKHSERHWDVWYFRYIEVEKVKHAISGMSMGKQTGLDEILVELWKSMDRRRCLKKGGRVQWFCCTRTIWNHGKIFDYKSHQSCEEADRKTSRKEEGLHMIHIDLENACDKVPREVLW
ncbi:hypothetical protein H5410_026618 [Solanum commersonii]|uniref:Uncharacterized protein n=1 Tax=Solanum commersonii TaxID=4109 RepID=A0A9J5Z213_SOLCO|nr:hypothetical protein H5410_026618 [Solanum commersonii]